jgi:hypothetical protein
VPDNPTALPLTAFPTEPPGEAGVQTAVAPAVVMMRRKGGILSVLSSIFLSLHIFVQLSINLSIFLFM